MSTRRARSLVVLFAGVLLALGGCCGEEAAFVGGTAHRTLTPEGWRWSTSTSSSEYVIHGRR